MTNHPSSKEKAQSYIEEIRSISGVVACALVSQDGFVMGKYSRDNGQTPSLFAAMSATIFASAEAAASAVQISSPSSIMVTTADATILVVCVGSEALITAVVEKTANPAAVCEQLTTVAVKIGEEI